MIKKLLVILAVSTVIAGAGVLVARHYDSYKVERDRIAAQAQQAKADAEQAVKAKQDAVQTEFDKHYRALQVQCDAGLYAWNHLTAWQKKQSPQPVCN